MLHKLSQLAGYPIDITMTLLLMLTVIILTILVLTLFTNFNPTQFLNLVRDTQELKRLDMRITHDLKHTGFFTKLAFKIFCKGAERYAP
jgi:HAMP domain-containing protein